MNLQKSLILVEKLLYVHAPHLLDEGWTVDITSRANRRFGCCVYRRKEILLSEKFVLLNTPDRVEAVGLHEVAHAMVGPGHGHGLVWQRQAILIGAEPTRCDSISVQSPGKYVAVCPNPMCGRVYKRHKRPKPTAIYWCRDCGRTKVLNFTLYEEKPSFDVDALLDEI